VQPPGGRTGFGSFGLVVPPPPSPAQPCAPLGRTRAGAQAALYFLVCTRRAPADARLAGNNTDADGFGLVVPPPPAPAPPYAPNSHTHIAAGARLLSLASLDFMSCGDVQGVVQKECWAMDLFMYSRYATHAIHHLVYMLNMLYTYYGTRQ